MSIYAIGVFATFVLYVIVGNYAGKKVKNIDDYYVAGRNAPTLLIVGTLMASVMSAVGFLGDTGFSYDGYVMLLLLLNALICLGYVFGSLYFGRYLRRSEALTLPEYFGKRFDSRAVQAAAAVVLIFGISTYLVAVTQGAAILMTELIGTSYLASLIIVWVVYTSFTFYSGSKGVLITDTMMFFLFTAAALLGAVVIVWAGGGWSHMITTMANYDLKPGILAYHGMITGPNASWTSASDALIWAFLLGLAWLTVYAVSPWQAGRYLMAKNEHVVLRVGIIAGVIMLLTEFFLQISGAAINLSNPGITPSEKAYIWAAFNIMPTWMGIVLLGGIMAAALSSCSTFLSLIGFSIERDIIKRPETSLSFSRMVMLVTGIVVLIFTYFQPPAVLQIGYFAAQIFAAAWSIVAFLSIWSKRLTKTGALAGLIAGFIGVWGAKLLQTVGGVTLPVILQPVVVGWIFCVIAIAIGTSLTQVTENERKYREKLFITPIDFYNPVELRRTLLYSKVAIATGVIFTILLIIIYTIPYNNALL